MDADTDGTKTKGEAPKLRGEFVYTESTKYRTKGIPETQASTWGMKQVIVKEEDNKKKRVTYEDQVAAHKLWHESPREGRASSNHTPIGSPEFLDVDEDTGRCNMCGQGNLLLLLHTLSCSLLLLRTLCRSGLERLDHDR